MNAGETEDQGGFIRAQHIYPLLQNGKNGSISIMTKEEMWDRLNTYQFPSIRPDDVREWFSENQDDESLAEVLAQVCNRTACLMAESSESDDPWLEVIFYDWDELEEELLQECLTRLKEKGMLQDAEGRYGQIKPFMEKYGYRNGNGWWIKNEKNQT